MTRRERKRASRERRAERQRLVHWAGCIVDHCGSKQCWLYDADAIKDNFREPAGIRVPRSLRGVYGGPRVPA